MDLVTGVQILNEDVCVSLLGKVMYPSVLPPMGKTVGQTGLFSLSKTTSLEGKLNSNQLHSA